MSRSEDELAEALAQSEAWLDAVNPDEVPGEAIDDRKDLRQVGVALIAIEAAEQALVSAVAHARANKRSWTDIANVLGVSRQAARQRFDHRVAEYDPDASLRLLVGSFSESAHLDVQTYLAHLDAAGLSELSGRIREYLRRLLRDAELDRLASPVKGAREAHKPN